MCAPCRCLDLLYMQRDRNHEKKKGEINSPFFYIYFSILIRACLDLFYVLRDRNNKIEKGEINSPFFKSR